MKINFESNQNMYNYTQIITTIVFGYLGAIVPNNKSNIPHLLLSVIFGGLSSKIIFGDWDIGYKWTISDIFYWFFTIIESLLGGLVALYI